VIFERLYHLKICSYFSVSINIGNPPKAFELDIDTGSDLTWVQCHLPCTGCTQPVERQYKPNNNAVPCSDILCKNAHPTGNVYCPEPDDQCDYEVEYADGGSSLGVLLADSFPFHSADISSLLRPRLAFGCGYDQKNPSPTSPSTAGVLGLGNGKASIISQLQKMGLMQNVIGHCFSRLGGGYLFLGNSLVPSSGVSWTPMLRAGSKHYSAGPAELVFSGKYTGLKGLQLIFDSGSSYTYFNSAVYKTTLDLIKKDLNGKLKDAPEEKALSVCWKGSKPFKSVDDVKGHFKTLALSFTRSKNGQLEIPPENYLIVTKNGNVCLGILNGSEVGLGNFNVIGDIFMQDQLVIYDNEKQQIGWIPSNCKKPQKS
ncbi:Aspartic proteinase Asp1, partial [Linum grandiflorum]